MAPAELGLREEVVRHRRVLVVRVERGDRRPRPVQGVLDQPCPGGVTRSLAQVGQSEDRVREGPGTGLGDAGVRDLLDGAPGRDEGGGEVVGQQLGVRDLDEQGDPVVRAAR